jgi:hypothetical protein
MLLFGEVLAAVQPIGARRAKCASRVHIAWAKRYVWACDMWHGSRSATCREELGASDQATRGAACRTWNKAVGPSQGVGDQQKKEASPGLAHR